MKKHYFLMSVLTAVISVLSVHGQSTDPGDKFISINANRVALEEVIKQIEQSSGLFFIYKSEELDLKRPVTLRMTDAPIRTVLSEFLKNSGLTFEITPPNIILKKETLPAQQQESQPTRVSGRIIESSTGDPISFVLVSIPGTTVNTVSDGNGSYSINVPQGATKLSFTMLGYTTREVEIGGRTAVNIELDHETTVMDQIVVTALGIKRSEKALGYATQKVSGEKLNTVMGLTPVTSLTGQVSGLNIYNSTEFYTDPTISLRGKTPLLVIDGVPASGVGRLSEINPDTIESIDILKGGAASALYGERGDGGAIMVTTKRGKKGFSVDFNTSNMFFSGHLKIAKPQTKYSSGTNGKYDSYDYVWGDLLDAGKTARQYDPIAQEWVDDMPLTSKGKNNYKNFLETGFISNTSVSVSQRGENGGFRASMNYLANKGQYPNAKMQRVGLAMGGDMKLGKKVTVTGSMDYNKTMAPNTSGTGYNNQGYIYQLLIWTGANYDIRDYKNNYWMKGQKDVKQNWLYNAWYDNPYLMAYEKLQTVENDRMSARLSLDYQITDWMSLNVKNGFETLTDRTNKRSPGNINSTRNWGGNGRAYYYLYNYDYLALNNDILLHVDKRFGKFGLDFAGGFSNYFYKYQTMSMTSNGGLVIPGWYSIHNSSQSPTVGRTLYRKGILGLYGKLALDWDGMVYLDVTGRNDWTSTLPKADRSYFYPSFALSAIVSEMATLPEWFSFLKLRGSWVMAKQDLGVYDTNIAYTTQLNQWDNNNYMYASTNERSLSIKPTTERTLELGSQMYFLNGRVGFDFAYFNRLQYNRTGSQTPSYYSGLRTITVNSGEERVTRGIEFTLSGTPVKTRDFTWNISTNWTKYATYYAKLDPVFTGSYGAPWVKEGERTDWRAFANIARDPDGNIIHASNGRVAMESFSSFQGYNAPDWIWGVSTNLRYKDFSLGISVDGRVGGMLYSSTDANMWSSGSHPDSDNAHRYDMVANGARYLSEGVKVVSGSVTYKDNYGTVDTDTRVFAPNDITTTYQSWATHFYTQSINTYLNTSFVKLRELSLTYHIPGRISKKIGATNASISFIGQNLMMWTKEFRWVDPDGMSDDLSSPSQRFLGVNLKLSF